MRSKHPILQWRCFCDHDKPLFWDQETLFCDQENLLRYEYYYSDQETLFYNEDILRSLAFFLRSRDSFFIKKLFCDQKSLSKYYCVPSRDPFLHWRYFCDNEPLFWYQETLLRSRNIIFVIKRLLTFAQNIVDCPLFVYLSCHLFKNYLSLLYFFSTRKQYFVIRRLSWDQDTFLRSRIHFLRSRNSFAINILFWNLNTLFGDLKNIFVIKRLTFAKYIFHCLFFIFLSYYSLKNWIFFWLRCFILHSRDFLQSRDLFYNIFYCLLFLLLSYLTHSKTFHHFHFCSVFCFWIRKLYFPLKRLFWD